MKGLNLGRAKPLLAGRRLVRTALLIGMSGATAGSLLFTAVAAHAADPSGVGTDPNSTLTFTNASTNLPESSGPGTDLLKWNTSDACPSGDNSSAIVATIDPDTNKQDSLASLSASGAGPYSGTSMDDTVQHLFQSFTDQSSPTFELVVVCSSGAGGSESSAFVFYQWAYITYTASSNTFVVSSTGPTKIATTTTLTSVDNTNGTLGTNTANTGDSVTFTAKVTDSDSTTPAGNVLFQMNGTNIGTEPVAVAALSGGGFGATVTTSFATAGPYSITAVFTPSNTAYASSSATPPLSETVTVAGSISANVTENLTVPNNGTITVSIDTNAIPLVAGTGSYVATGDFGTQSPTGPNSLSSTAGVQVIDSRNTFPGWYVTGQTSNFTLGANTISGNQLGWAPNTGESFAASGTSEAILGPTVAPASPGIGSTAGVLFSAPAGGGFGTFDASALLTLDIPTTSPPGAYTGTLTITALTAHP
jgi:Bacterial Ig-like domain (group 3)